MNECKNCGADYGLHHANTNQCPMNGREAPIGRKKEWKSTTFEERTEGQQAYEKMMALIVSLEERIEALEADLEERKADEHLQHMVALYKVEK